MHGSSHKRLSVSPWPAYLASIDDYGQLYHPCGGLCSLRRVVPFRLRCQLAHCSQSVSYRGQRLLDLSAPHKQKYSVVRCVALVHACRHWINLAFAARSTKSLRSVVCSPSRSARRAHSLAPSTRSALKGIDRHSLLPSPQAKLPL